MRKPDILLVTPLSPGEDEQLDADYAVHRLWELTDLESFLQETSERLRAVVTTGATGVDVALMERLPALEIVAGFGVGYDRVDLHYAAQRGIRVTNTPDVLTDGVADMALGLILAVTRRIPFGDRWVRDGRWLNGPMPLTRGLGGKRLGIVGLGRIGRAVARRAEPFGVEILYTDRQPVADSAYGWREDVVALARDSDILVLCAAGGDATRHLVDAAVLDALGPQGYVVNIARGTLIDEPALLDALQEGRIAGAALDVYDNEPTIDPRFAGIDTVVLQPHSGSGTYETRAAIGSLMRANLAAHFAGQPLPTPVI
jgi:lactate dehydrogenase-like 2-hydroxyacid dehydrogenase